MDRHGAARHDRAALVVLDQLSAVLVQVEQGQAGIRLCGIPGLASLLASEGSIGRVAAEYLGPDACPVRAIMFDKVPGRNWALGWHQDRTIAVRTRIALPGWGPWSVKAGIQHVEPPFALIEHMITVRVHIDDVPADNAPLLIAPGSHRLGRVPAIAIAAAVAQCGTATCLAMRGDIWAYSTAILHASAAACGHAHRRVLQVDYATTALPAPLAWLGV